MQVNDERVETEVMKERRNRSRLLTRLSRLPVKYKKARAQTTIAGGYTPGTTTTTLMSDVLEFDKGMNTAEADTHQLTTFMGYIFHGTEKPQNLAVEVLPELIADAENYLWIDLSRPVADDLQLLAEVLKIDTSAVQVILSGSGSPRLDVFDDHFFVTATIPQLETRPYRVHAHQLSLIVGENFLLTAHQNPLPFAERILARLSLHVEKSAIESTFLLYIVLDELMAYYEELNVRIQEQIERMEERALIDPTDSFLTDLLHFKRYAFALSQVAAQHRSVFGVFQRPDFHYVAEHNVLLYYRDLEARLTRLIDSLMAAKESVNGIFDIYVSHVSHRTNSIMKILTMVSTVLLPATVILTFFSTYNIEDSPILTHTIGFLVMVGSIVCVSAAIIWRFRRQGWL
jgi:magnesium transporter